jgi:hypothetical protein
MKRFFFIPLLALLFAFTATAQNDAKTNKNKQYQVAGIAFYNLENLFDTINNNGKYDEEFSPSGSRQWTGEKYWSKINNLAYAISQFATKTTPIGPAIIGVSEVENKSVLVDLVNAKNLKKWNLQVVHHDSPDRRGVDVSLLYNPMLFKMENVTNHTLTIEGRPDFRTRDQMCVVGKLMGQPLAVIVNHWPSRLGGEQQSSYLREAAAALSKHIADSLWKVNPDMGVIIMGDMNDDPQNKSCAKVLNAQKDIKNATYHGFYNPFWKILDSGIGTLAYKSSWNLFDQIILSGNLANGDDNKFHYWKAIVHNKEFLKDKEGTRQGYPLRTYSAGVWLNGYSDHFPTEVFLIREVGEAN